MKINDLLLIGESINDSVPTTQELFNNNDLEGIKHLAKLQDEGGAAYIDINIGKRTPDLMAKYVKAVQEISSKPLAIDSPDPEIIKAGLEVYQAEKAEGKKPLLNSIALARKEMFDLYKIQKFCPILLVTETCENGVSKMNNTKDDIYNTAKTMLALAHSFNIKNEDCIFDVGIAPIALDTEGHTKRTIEAISYIHSDKQFVNCNFSLGLSNFTHMLPAKRASDNMPIRSALESALITILQPLGLNMIIGSVKRKYRILEENHPALLALHEMLKSDGYELMTKLQEFYM